MELASLKIALNSIALIGAILFFCYTFALQPKNEKMKTNKILLFFCVIATTISSCQDGDLGVSSFKILNASGLAYNFSTSDPNLPLTPNYNEVYTTKAGTYNYYYDYGFTYYAGSYTIVQLQGDTWNGFTDGFATQPASGKKRDYTFNCDAASGDELSYKNMMLNHADIIIEKTIHFDGGKMIIKGKGVYDPKHILNPKNTKTPK